MIMIDMRPDELHSVRDRCPATPVPTEVTVFLSDGHLCATLPGNRAAEGALDAGSAVREVAELPTRIDLGRPAA